MKQHEQAAPINREMRQLINSLQSHNRQLKTEINRCKKKVREYQEYVGYFKITFKPIIDIENNNLTVLRQFYWHSFQYLKRNYKND